VISEREYGIGSDILKKKRGRKGQGRHFGRGGHVLLVNEVIIIKVARTIRAARSYPSSIGGRYMKNYPLQSAQPQ